MLLSAVSVLVVAQSSSEIPEGLMNNPVFYRPKFCRHLFSTACSITENPPSSFVPSSHLHFVKTTNFKFLIMHFSPVCHFFLPPSQFYLNPLLWETEFHIKLKIKGELREQTFQESKANYMGWSSWDTKLLFLSADFLLKDWRIMTRLEAKYKTSYFLEFLRTKRKLWNSCFVHISWGFFLFVIPCIILAHCYWTVMLINKEKSSTVTKKSLHFKHLKPTGYVMNQQV